MCAFVRFFVFTGTRTALGDSGRLLSLSKRTGRSVTDQLVPDHRSSSWPPSVHGTQVRACVHGGALTPVAGGERPVSSTLYALFVVAARAPHLGVAKLIASIAHEQRLES